MEMPLRAIMVMLVLLIAALVVASLILGWGGQAQNWFLDSIKEFSKIVLGG